MRNTPADFINFINKYVGGYYWFGTIAGQIPTTALLNAKTKQYPSHYTANRMTKYNKAIKEHAHISDCTGLIKGYFMSTDGSFKYNSKYDLNDIGWINTSPKSGNISTMPDIAGIGLWKKGHVAIYIGNNEIIEAAGFSYGIRKIKLDKSRFNKWFYIPYLNYDAPANAPAPTNVNYNVDDLASRVIRGEFGNGLERKQKLNALGYGNIYDKVQTRVNELIYKK